MFGVDVYLKTQTKNPVVFDFAKTYRLLVVVLPLAWIFSGLTNASTMIWFAFPIAELAAAIMAVIFMIQASKRVSRLLKDTAQ